MSRRIFSRWLLLLAALVIFTESEPAWAWGPATHVKLAGDILANLTLLPAGVAALIAAHRRYFLYGNVATDTVFAKKMSRVKQICHHWSTGFGLLADAPSDSARAFAYGYLAHLAADTVAHNKYLPHQMAISRSTVSFGHLYWEVRADARINSPQWERLRALLHGHYPEPAQMLSARLRETLLPFRANQILFKRMNLLVSERAWRGTVAYWSQFSRFALEQEKLRAYHDESLQRVFDVLGRGAASSVLHEDPNGNANLDFAKEQRRLLRRLHRARMPHAHVVQEAALGHAPQSILHMETAGAQSTRSL